MSTYQRWQVQGLIVFLRELLSESANVQPSKKLGRTFNHLEDLTFFYGSKGTSEALQHLKEFSSDAGSRSIRMKWDGSPQIYWGRERAGGPLIIAGHNGWARGVKSASPEQLYEFIVNQSGNTKTLEEQVSRKAFAQEFASVYKLLDDATPKDFVGFVYGDALFLNRPQLDEQGNYSFSPNPNTNTTYHVKPSSSLGKRIAEAQAMVVGHAYFPKFGMDDDAQQPLSEFKQFNNTSALIVQEPIYNARSLKVNAYDLQQAEKLLKHHAGKIDKFLEGTAGLADLKDIIYRFVNQTAKAKKLDNISSKLFFEWLKTSKVSVSKQQRIVELNESNKTALDAIFELVHSIQTVKDDLIKQLEEGHSADIWDTNGEGRVRYATEDKQFGHIKLVPRKRWTPK